MPKVKPAKSGFAKRLESQGVKVSKDRDKPLWDGPENDGSNGGVTQSLIARAVSCSERFRLKVIEGLSPVDTFSHRMEYGNMWHLCEEALASEKNHFKDEQHGIMTTLMDDNLKKYVRELGQRYRTSGEEIAHWYNVCRTQFPIYVDHWAKHPDILKRTPILQEQVFHVPYVLPSGRTVYLRGKWDSVDLVENKKDRSIWVVENKSKGDINEQQIVRQLSFDLQSLFYFIALQSYQHDVAQDSPPDDPWTTPIVGVRYNVIRRPLSGGKHTIRQHQPTKSNPSGESKEEFYARLGELIKGEPDFFFMRWNVRITEADVERFKAEFLTPFLENLCDDYEWWTFCKEKKIDPFRGQWGDGTVRRPEHHWHRHYRLPYGIYNPVAEGTIGEYDDHLATGSMLGLTTETDLFRELR